MTKEDVIGGTVAPHAGARIETTSQMPRGYGHRSLPVRERGSKRWIVSHPRLLHLVAPRAGARIETCSAACAHPERRVAPHRGSKHLQHRLELALVQSLPAGSADRNIEAFEGKYNHAC